MTTTAATRKRRAERTRREILGAARRLVRERGVQAFSLREVARLVDFSPAGLYEYFEGKDALIAALCGEVAADLVQRLGQVPADLAPRERLIRTGLAYIEHARANPDLGILSLNDPRWPASRAQATGTGLDIVVDIIGSGVKSGDFALRAGETPLSLAYYCWAMVHGLATLGAALPRNALPGGRERADRAALEALADGLARRRANSSPSGPRERGSSGRRRNA
jgi:TetR/AcrR family transcriptional repressor of the ameABC operon